jgi:hypothetical protein
MDEIINNYLASLSPKEYKAYLIAKDHLQDSFQIEKSNGFLAWVKKENIQLGLGAAAGAAAKSGTV